LLGEPPIFQQVDRVTQAASHGQLTFKRRLAERELKDRLALGHPLLQ